jgi:hypothetical protein
VNVDGNVTNDSASSAINASFNQIPPAQRLFADSLN